MITSYETCNTDTLKTIIENLEKFLYYNNVTYDNGHIGTIYKKLVKYLLSYRHMETIARDYSPSDNSPYGRLYSMNGLQNMHRCIRNAIVDTIMRDIDFINAAPTIIEYVAKNIDDPIDVPILSDFNNNRDKYLLEAYNVKYKTNLKDLNTDQKGDAKRLIFGILFNSPLVLDIPWWSEFMEEVKLIIYKCLTCPQLHQIRRELCNEDAAESHDMDFGYKCLFDNNYNGRLMYSVFQSFENLCLMQLYEFLKDSGCIKDNICVFMFDGLMLKDSELLTDELLEKASDYVKEKTGIPLIAKYKEMEYTKVKLKLVTRPYLYTTDDTDGVDVSAAIFSPELDKTFNVFTINSYNMKVVSQVKKFIEEYNEKIFFDQGMLYICNNNIIFCNYWLEIYKLSKSLLKEIKNVNPNTKYNVDHIREQVISKVPTLNYKLVDVISKTFGYVLLNNGILDLKNGELVNDDNLFFRTRIKIDFKKLELDDYKDTKLYKFLCNCLKDETYREFLQIIIKTISNEVKENICIRISNPDVYNFFIKLAFNNDYIAICRCDSWPTTHSTDLIGNLMYNRLIHSCDSKLKDLFYNLPISSLGEFTRPSIVPFKDYTVKFIVPNSDCDDSILKKHKLFNLKWDNFMKNKINGSDTNIFYNFIIEHGLFTDTSTISSKTSLPRPNAKFLRALLKTKQNNPDSRKYFIDDPYLNSNRKLRYRNHLLC